MRLIRSIPGIEIHAPIAFVGRPFDVAVVLRADVETRIKHVDVRLVCKQGWFNAGAYHHIVHPDRTVRLMERAVLRAGMTRVDARFELPAGMAPSHRLDPAFSSAELTARVAVSRWRAGTQTITPVLQLAVDDPSRTPVVARAPNPGERVSEIRLEVSLASTRLIAGETVHGRCAVFGLEDHAPREVRFQFVPELTLHGTYGHTFGGWNRVLGTTVTLPAGTGGTSVPFELEVPADATPSFAAITHRLSRELLVTTGSAAAPELHVRIPIQILDPGVASQMARMRPPPPLADERIADLFGGFAASHGWHAAAADAGIGHAIERSVDGCNLRLSIEYRGRRGAVLVSRARYRSLGLGLAVSPNTLLRTVIRDDFDVGIPAWDRARHVVGRSPEQVVPVLLAVVPVIVLGELGELRRWDDHEIAFEQPAISVEDRGFAALDRNLARVAAAIAEARGAIAPPSGVVDLEGWRALARELHGELSPGDLAIDGSLGRIPVGIVVRWDGTRPIGVDVAVGSHDTASAEARTVAIAVARPASEVVTDPSTKRLVSVHPWSPDVIDLRVVEGVASATLEAISSHGARELVKALHRVRVALDPATGPYR